MSKGSLGCHRALLLTAVESEMTKSALDKTVMCPVLIDIPERKMCDGL